MKKPKWCKRMGGYNRGVLEVQETHGGIWASRADGWYIAYHYTPEAAMKAADAWWEKTRKKMEGK